MVEVSIGGHGGEGAKGFGVPFKASLLVFFAITFDWHNMNLVLKLINYSFIYQFDPIKK